jgi:hypothetical protein
MPSEVAADVEPLSEADAVRVTIASAGDGEDTDQELEPPAPVWEEAR